MTSLFLPRQALRGGRWLLALSVALLVADVTQAAMVTKLNTSSMAANTSNWSSAPGTADVGAFDNTLSTGNAAALTLGGANLSIGGLLFSNNLNGPVTILAGNTLTLNTNVTSTNTLDLTAANQNVTINCGLVIGTNGGVWNVGTGRTLTIAGVITTNGAAGNAIIKDGSGTLILTNANTYGGGTTVRGGILLVTNLADSGTSAIGTNGTLTLSGGTLDFAGSSGTSTRPFVVSGANPSSVTVESGGALALIGNAAWSGNGGFTKSGSGTLSLTNNYNSDRISIDSIYGGSWTVSAGTLNLSSKSYFTIGESAFGTGSYNQTGGTVNFLAASGSFLGNGATNTAVMTISGGSFTQTANLLRVGQGQSSSATLNVGGGPGTGTLTVPQIMFSGNNQSAALGIVKLITNGQINVGFINQGIGSSACAFNFNGGTLKATTNQAAFMSGVKNAFVNAGGAVIDDGGFAITIAQALLAGSPSGGLAKQGNGTLTLSGVNTYTGATTVSAGELVGVTGSGLASSALTVNNGATNGVQLVANGGNGQWTCAGLTYAAGNTYADFNFATVPGTNAPAFLKVNGNLTNNGTINVICRGAIPSGQFPLIKYTGTLSGSLPAAPVSLPAGVTATLSNNVANQSLDLVVTSGNILAWAVAGGGVWDINASANWNYSPGVPVVYSDGSQVFFNDSVAGGTITLASNVSPGSVSINNSASSYTLAGTNSISGVTALVKQGAGSLTLALSNNFTGGTTLLAGQLNLNNSNSIGTGVLTIYGGTLDNTSGSATALARTNTQAWNGDFTFAGSANLSLGNGAVALGGNRLVTVNANTLTEAGVISGAYGLTKAGAGTLTLSGLSTYTGGTIVNGGVLYLPTAGAGKGDVIGSLTVNTGAEVQSAAQWSLGYSSAQMVNNITLNNGTLSFVTGQSFAGNCGFSGNTITMSNATIRAANSGSGFDLYPGLGANQTTTINTLASASPSVISLTMNLRLGAAGAVVFNVAGGGSGNDMLVSGVIQQSAGGNVVKTGSGVLTLTANNTYTGSTTISAGELVGQTGGSCINSSVTNAPTGSGAATNGVYVAVSGGQWSCSNLTYTVGSGSVYYDCNFGQATPSTGTAPLLVNNNLTMASGTLNVIVRNGLNWSTGTYPLLQVSGTAPGSLTLNLVSQPNRVSGSLSYDSVNKVINYTVASVTQPITWTATGSGTWDVNDSGNQVWKDATSASTYYLDGDQVLFDDTGNGTVNLNTIVGPSGFAANNNSSSYLITGTGGVAGNVGLILNGSGTVTLATSNSCTGANTINGGILQLGDGTNRNGSVAGNITDNAALVFANPTNLTYGGVISGSGTLTKTANGTLFLSNISTYGGGTMVTNGTLTLAGNTGSPAGGAGRIRGSLAINTNATVNASKWDLGYNNGACVSSIIVDHGSLNINSSQGAGGTSASSITMTAGTIGVNATNNFGNSWGPYLDWFNGITGSPQLIVNPSDTTAAISAWLNLRLGSDLNSLTFNVAQGTTVNGVDLLIAGNITAGGGTPGGSINKTGAGTVVFAGTNSYTGTTTVNAGQLLVTGVMPVGALTVAANATLGGTGLILGPVDVQTGGTLQPGGMLTISNTLTLQTDSTNIMFLNKTAATNAVVSGVSTLSYNGTLVVTNRGGTLGAGDQFQLFSATNSIGNFASIVGSPGANLAYEFNPTNGILSVIRTGGAPSPTNIVATVIGGSLVLTWPNGQGWLLEVQTNTPATGLGNNWVTNASATSPFTNAIDPANGSVFYRLIYP